MASGTLANPRTNYRVCLNAAAILAVVFFSYARPAQAQDAVPAREIKVLPVFFVPKGEPNPSPDQTKRLLRHLDWSRTRYRELLGERGAFAIADTKPRVYR